MTAVVATETTGALESDPNIGAIPGAPEAPRVPALADLTVGDVVAEKTYHLTRDSLVKYAAASGDFNPIHYRDDVANSVGLPGVIAHGVLTMSVSAQLVADWLGSAGFVSDFQARFTRPVPVDGTDGADVVVTATVGLIDTVGARIDLAVLFDGAKVLGKSQARVVFTTGAAHAGTAAE
ncbi:MAG: acyl dehydratase [Glaciihabitans sp.]|nr:acyl dehydratase [Glaciihabitans sp.]